MAYNVTDNRLGVQPIADRNTVAQHSLGTIVRGEDSALGTGEFVYLKGAANTTVGLMVNWNPVAGTTTLTPNTGALGQPLAVAMAANTASYYGWYQIEGAAVIKKAAINFAPNVAVYQSATTGRITATAACGKQILGARTINAASVASATSTISVLINRPHSQGQIT